MKALTFSLLRMLADGNFHSSQDMARALGVSQGNIVDLGHAFDQSGLEILKVPGRGYRLSSPITLLDSLKIATALGRHAASFRLELLEHAASTNISLLRRAGEGAPRGTVVAAEWQTRGRGRRGRAWHSPPAQGLTFSLLWRFERSARFLSGLSLAVALAIARALTALGARGVGLKWPNDVLWHGKKLAGILIEAQGNVHESSTTVIGIGLNCRLTDSARAEIGRPVADLYEACGTSPDRNLVLARVLVELERVLVLFAVEGLAPFRDEWKRNDAYYLKRVNIALPRNKVIMGTVRGIANDGALVLDTPQGRRQFYGGELSLRPASTALADLGA